MALTEEQKKIKNDLVSCAHEKGYRDESIELLLMFVCAAPLVEKVGTTTEAAKKIIEFIKESETSEKCFDQILNFIGIK